MRRPTCSRRHGRSARGCVRPTAAGSLPRTCSAPRGTARPARSHRRRTAPPPPRRRRRPPRIALVTGANRGIGRHFAQQLLARGAAKVYAAARRPETIDVPGVIALALDVTDPDAITAAASVANDLTLLVNNAGVSTGTDLVSGDLTAIRSELDTNFYGPLL